MKRILYVALACIFIVWIGGVPPAAAEIDFGGGVTLKAATTDSTETGVDLNGTWLYVMDRGALIVEVAAGPMFSAETPGEGGVGIGYAIALKDGGPELYLMGRYALRVNENVVMTHGAGGEFGALFPTGDQWMRVGLRAIKFKYDEPLPEEEPYDIQVIVGAVWAWGGPQGD